MKIFAGTLCQWDLGVDLIYDESQTLWAQNVFVPLMSNGTQGLI